MNKQGVLQEDPWYGLKAFTAARIALGRVGTSEPLKAMLAFRLAHANARDAVHAAMDTDRLIDELQGMGCDSFALHSKAANRSEYLQYPDRGRVLNGSSVEQLKSFTNRSTAKSSLYTDRKRLKSHDDTDYDICIVVADGLSATAVNSHAIPVLQLLLPLLQSAKLTVAPICLAQQGRVAIGDEIGYLLQAKLVVVLIGERPGLSSPDSLGAYLTYQPRPGLTDESRNCISNIRPEGLIYLHAADKLLFFINLALHLQISGVELKDTQQLLPGEE